MAARLEQTSRFRWLLGDYLQRLWVRVTAFAVLGVLTAVTGYWMRNLIPDGLSGRIGADAIEPILEIIASSMLTVTTFSLSILTAAYATASSGSTPRAVRLLVRDQTSQTVLATFIGAFVFSLVGLIMLKTQLYGEEGRVLLFGMTLLVVLLVVISLLRWISRLGEMGLVGDTLALMEKATSVALAKRLESPWLGANPLRADPSADGSALFPDCVGNLQHCDMPCLSDMAEEHGLTIYLLITPGDLAHPGQPVMRVVGLPDSDADLRQELLACLTFRPQRDFRQDPQFGLASLSEVAQRALSPAVNDPGTAIAVVHAILRVLAVWRDPMVPEVVYPRLYLRGLDPERMIRDSLLPLARDGANHFELHLALQEVIAALGRIGPEVFAAPAARLARDVMTLAECEKMLPSQAQTLRSLADHGHAGQ